MNSANEIIVGTIIVDGVKIYITRDCVDNPELNLHRSDFPNVKINNFLSDNLSVEVTTSQFQQNDAQIEAALVSQLMDSYTMEIALEDVLPKCSKKRQTKEVHFDCLNRDEKIICRFYRANTFLTRYNTEYTLIKLNPLTARYEHQSTYTDLKNRSDSDLEKQHNKKSTEIYKKLVELVAIDTNKKIKSHYQKLVAEYDQEFGGYLTDIEHKMSQFANMAYCLSSGGNNSADKQEKITKYQQQIDDHENYTVVLADNNFTIMANEQQKEVYLLVTGTRTSVSEHGLYQVLDDLMHDYNIIMCHSLPRIETFTNLIESRLNQYRNQGYKIYATGHSLGGYIVNILAERYPWMSCFSFNAPGISRFDFPQLPSDPDGNYFIDDEKLWVATSNHKT